jgi:hypothetical protein
MYRSIALVCLVCIGLPAVCRADDPEPQPIKVRFDQLKSRHMVVEVKVNGHGPFKLIFDTGAPVTLLNNRLAKAAQVFPKGYKPSPFAMFGAASKPFTIKTLEIGDVVAHDMPAIVMDHPTVEFVSRIAGPIDGIVGFSFFARYRLTIDYQNKEMTFVPTKFMPPDPMQNLLKLLTASKAKKDVLAPAGQWGFRVAKEPKDQEPGVTVAAVLAGSPAAAAGLRVGDRLLTLEGYWTDSVNDCYLAASHVQPGAAARITIQRQGKPQELTVKVQAGL